MERLDGPLADLIAAEKQEMEAAPRSRDAAWAGIAAAWEPLPPPSPPAGVSETAATASKAGTLKLVAALVVGTSAASGAWLASRDDLADPIARVEAPDAAAIADAPTSRPEPLTAPVLGTPPPRPDSPTPAPEPTKVPAKKRPLAKPGLAEELALVDSMRTDVAAGRYAKALTRAKQHRERFPEGSLAADRMDLEAAARCGQGDLEAGQKIASRKMKLWPRAPISTRLRALCNLEKR